MQCFRCIVCDFIYKPGKEKNNHHGNNIAFSELPGAWRCPECGANKKFFIKVIIDENNVSNKK